MSDTIKGIKIDVVNKTITEVEVRKGNLQDIYDVIGNGCGTFQCIDIGSFDGDIIYIDEEGLFHEFIGGFVPSVGRYADSPITGNGLILGGTPDGDSADVLLSVDEAETIITIL